MYNVTSNHDAQLTLILDINMSSHPSCSWVIRKIDKRSLLSFNDGLSFELWNEVFDENNVNIMFSTFFK
jgi:hypothetical protein